MSDKITKEADGWLNIWADEVRTGNNIDLGANISSAYGQHVYGTENKEDLAALIDNLVGGLPNDPFKRVIKRYYLDPLKENQMFFHKKNYRTVRMKARDEGMTESTFRDYLRVARHMIWYAMGRAKFHAA